MKRVIAGLMALSLLSGCATIGNVNMEEGLGGTLGAVAGGVIGYQFGGGAGQILATTAGAVLGGVAGLYGGDWWADQTPEKADPGLFK